MTFEFEISNVSRVLTPLCCLPEEEKARGMRLLCDVIMYSPQTGTEKS